MINLNDNKSIIICGISLLVLGILNLKRRLDDIRGSL